MADIYVYDKACEDFTNFGLVGALTPTECTFEEEANGLSEITLEHPLDDFGRFTALQRDNLLIAEVPVRTTPEIQDGTIVTSVEQWTVKAASTITKAQRTIYKKQTGNRKLKVVPGGTEVTVVQKPAEGRYKVKCRYGTGWMDPDALNYVEAETIADNSQSIESVQPAWTVKPQIFRIYNVEKNIDSVTVSARHISYDLLYNLTTYKNEAAVSCKDALAGIMDGCVAAHDFDAYTNLADTRTGVDWTRVNPISALLDPETGLTARYGAALVRDNWELYVLHDPGLNRGVTVEYAKNMIGLTCTENAENVVTRIIPIGETKKGEDLLLDGTAWVDSSHINDYPIPHIQELKCENCKVGTDGVTTAIARARMREQAQAVFDNGGDLPEIDMSVEFIMLGDTAEYAQYKDLDRLFLWDYVIIRHKKLGLDVTARVAAVKWDCILGRMVSMEIGKVGKTLANTGITTWQIPTGFSGGKIAGGTVGGRALQNDIISARHIQSESIYTEALQAFCVTAAKIAAGTITADKLDADTVNARVLEVVKAKIASLTAENIETDELATELARVTVLICGSASFDKATIKHLVAEAMNLEYGVAGQVFIRNLAVEYAQMVGATIGNLCIKSKDGKYYLLDVDADGNVTATETTVTDSEIEAGQTSDGNVIVETNMTVANLNTTNLLATYALINKIDAARIDVDELIARSVFTDALYTSAIYGGRSLKTIVDGLTEADIYDSVTPPEAAETGKKWLDRGVSPSQLRRWKGLTTTPQGDTITTAREIDESVSGTSVSIDNSNNQLSGPLSVTVQGKNLLDIYALCDGITGVQGGTISKWASSGGFEIDATADDCYTEPWNGANDIPVKPNTTYTFSWGIYITPTLGTSQVMWFIDRRYPESGYYGAANYDAYSVTFTTPADAKFVSFRFGLQKSGDKIGYGSLQLEEGSAKTTFSAYKTSVTVTHNGTAYALPLDTVDHSANIDISPSIGVNAVSTDADSMDVEYICSGWETVNDPDALNDLFQTQITQTKDSLSAEITNLRTDISLYLRSYKDADNNIEGVELGRTDTNTVSRIVPGAFQVWAPDDSGQMVKTASLGNRESQIGRLRIYQTADGGTAFNVM